MNFPSYQLGMLAWWNIIQPMGGLSLQDQTTLQQKVTLPMDTSGPQGWKEMRKRRRIILMNPFLMISLATEQFENRQISDIQVFFVASYSFVVTFRDWYIYLLLQYFYMFVAVHARHKNAYSGLDFRRASTYGSILYLWRSGIQWHKFFLLYNGKFYTKWSLLYNGKIFCAGKRVYLFIIKEKSYANSFNWRFSPNWVN